jgi:hypothetical protein
MSSDALDVLPIIIPFFGVTVCSGFIAICCLWRAVGSRFRGLEQRIEQLSILPINPPQSPPPLQPMPSYPMYPLSIQPPPSAIPYPLYNNGPYNV